MRRWYLFTASAFLIALAPLPAESVLFDFDSLSANVDSTPGADLIETTMEGIWGAAVGSTKKDITVNWGARTAGLRIENAFSTIYLGNSDSATAWNQTGTPPTNNRNTDSSSSTRDVYLYNRWNALLPSSGCGSSPCQRDRITIIFEQQPIISVEFDWEIFPINSNADIADFTFVADGVQYYYHPPLPSTAGSGLPTKFTGDVGHYSIVFETPVKKLEFIDWTTAPIGIDNLRVEAYTKPPLSPQSIAVPDGSPAVLILAVGFGALVIIASRGRRHTVP